MPLILVCEYEIEREFGLHIPQPKVEVPSVLLVIFMVILNSLSS